MTEPAARSPEERLSTIRALVVDRGTVRIETLAAEFGVSEMTVRRDLDALEALGLARRVRGGAVALGPERWERRHQHNARAKAKMADKLRPLVPDTGTVAFDASTTIHRLAASLSAARDLVVVTNGWDTFQALQDKAGVTACLTGGVREPKTDSLVGPIATRAARSYIYDVFFSSAAALDAEFGTSEATLAESEVKRAIAEVCGRVVLVVDSSKLGTRAQARVLDLEQVDVLVTDLHQSDHRLDPYRGVAEIV